MDDSTTITTADVEAAATSLASPDASAAASTPDQTSSASADATGPSSDPDPINDPSWGDIPQSRRPNILKNLSARAEKDRTAAVEAAQKDWESKTGWAKDINPQEAAIVREWVRRGNTDPAGLVVDLWQRVQNDPTHGARLRSEAARILGQRQQAQPPDADPQPGPDIPTDTSNGRPVVYSASQMQKLLEWQDRRSQARMQQTLQPYQQDLQTRRQADEYRQVQGQANAYAATTLKSVASAPGFADHQQAIAKEYAAMAVVDPRTGEMVPDPQDPRSEGEKLRDAYLKVVVPTLGQARVQQTVDDLHRKARASTVNPSQTHLGEPFNYKTASWEDALKHEWEKRKSG